MAEFDLIIEGGTIYDGTRFPAYVADIGIADGIITRIGNLTEEAAASRIDARGLNVAPGHIDVHTHFDGQVFWDPTCSCAGENGITTVLMANCGFGFAPCRPEDRQRAMEMMETTEQIPVPQLLAALPWDWVTFPEFLASLARTPKSVNATTYIPLNPLMIFVMGIEGAKTRRPTRDEIEQMKALISEAMDAGAVGLSLSSMGHVNNHVDFDGSPMPTDRANIEDICEIVKVFRERNEGIIQVISQIGPSGDSELSVRVAEASGRPILHNVFSTSRYRPNAHKDSMAWLDGVLAKGLTMYPMAAAHRAWTEQDFWNSPGNAPDSIPVHRLLTIESPTLEQKMAHATDPAYRERFRAEYRPELLDAIGGGLENYQIVSMGRDKPDHPWLGWTVGEVAAERGVPISDAYLDLAIETEFKLVLKTPSTAKDPKMVAELISHSHVLPGTSDGGAHTKIFSGGAWATDLLLGMVREHKFKTLEEMHYRLAYQPARAIGLRDRGALLEGMAADILVYDLDKLFFDESGYEVAFDMPNGDWRRKIRAGGYEWIIVNGTVTFHRDNFAGTTPGQMLRITENRRKRILLEA